VQVVQEYERAVIFRLGRLLPVGAKGPGEEAAKVKVLIVANMILVLTFSDINLNLIHVFACTSAYILLTSRAWYTLYSTSFAVNSCMDL